MTFKFNPQIALRVTRPKYIGMIVPDVKLKCITKILFQEDKKKKKDWCLPLTVQTKLIIITMVCEIKTTLKNCLLKFSLDFSDLDMHIYQSQANVMLHQMLIPDS